MPPARSLAFHIAPIGEVGTPTRMRSDTALDYVVRPALQDKYQIKRADEEALPGQISPQIIRDIVAADLIVCDLSELNPNVMYELSFAHSLCRPVIQIAAAGTRLPFDLMQSRTIFFNPEDPKSHREASAMVRSAEKKLREGGRISNPIVDSLEYRTHEDVAKGTWGHDDRFDEMKAQIEELRRQMSQVRAPDDVGDVVGRAERAFNPRPPRTSANGPKGQAAAAGRLIDRLAGRAGFERVAVDRTNARRLIVYGDAPLDAADVAGLVKGFDVELRPVWRA